MVSLKVLTGAPVEVEAELCPVAASEFIAWLRAASEAIELAVGLTVALVSTLAALLTVAVAALLVWLFTMLLVCVVAALLVVALTALLVLDGGDTVPATAFVLAVPATAPPVLLT